MRTIKSIINLLIFATSFVSCSETLEKQEIPVTSITLSRESIELVEGESITLMATVSPSDATYTKVSWSSSKSSVASVDQKGSVTALSVGSATITASAGGKSASCKVTVTAKTIAVSSITLDKTDLSLNVDEEYQLKVTIDPSNASEKNVSWSSLSSSIATVKDGLVKGVSVGETEIAASCGGKKAVCKVKITPIEVESITLSKTELDLFVGDSETISAAIEPQNATNQNVSWKSSNDRVATVNKGEITGIKEGDAIITASSGSKTASCRVTVKKKPVPIQSLTLNKSTLALAEGGSETLTVTITPSDATYEKVNWTSSNQNVATVTNGRVSALSEGTSTISVSAGDVSANCNVTVYKEGDERFNFLKLTILAQGDITIQCHRSDNLEYSTNGGKTWLKLPLIHLEDTWGYGGSRDHYYAAQSFRGGDHVLLRGKRSEPYYEQDTALKFGEFFGEDGRTINGSTATFSVSGNVMSIILGDDFISDTYSTVSLPSLFAGTKVVSAEQLVLPINQVKDCSEMFMGCELLQTPPKLPNTKLSKGCYKRMFYNCTSLATAPELPATILANYCYWDMFNGCTSLKKAPKLPSKTLAKYCYNRMFLGCTSLTEAVELPAKDLYDGCYGGMFALCSKITKAFDIDAERMHYTGGSGVDGINENEFTAYKYKDGAFMSSWGCCESMFFLCTSLTSPPRLQASELTERCYKSMFLDCVNLKTPPDLPATYLAEECYYDMFSGCTSITFSPQLPATQLARGCYLGMFRGCSSLTTPPNLPAASLADYCYSNMFSMCKSLVSAPELPAAYLTEGCYYGMFYECTSLSHAPVLPALYLVNKCYSAMFRNCRQLSYVKAMFIAADKSCLSEWLTGTTDFNTRSKTFVKNKNALWTTTAEANIPSGWSLINSE